ncbi:aldehyde dehydrogenase family protein [Streptomyces iakyrus]|uniref:aldehyde dehydrogenase family protein n=1 Tax=Streptomyces iakyrus TaxID=68219 RepID=UPI00367C0F0E
MRPGRQWRETDVPQVTAGLVEDDRSPRSPSPAATGPERVRCRGRARSEESPCWSCPRKQSTQVGSLARGDLRAAMQRQVEESVAAGARLLPGGRSVPGDGYFFQPTVLAGTGPGMAGFDEETFGPLAAPTVAHDDEDAVRLANATAFGLGSSVWTADAARGVGPARRITSGAAFVNAVVASDPRLPFGGTRRNGYGREPAAAGIREFTNTRTYWGAA